MISRETVLRILDQMQCGIALLDRVDSILCLNSSAERILSLHGGRKSQHRPVPTGWAVHALRRIFGKEILTSVEILVSNGLQCAAERPLIARKTTLWHVDQKICSILVLIDLNECHRPSIDILRLAFGLTVAEAKLAARLASGDSLRCIASDQNISVATVRAQLKRVLAKTHTHRQAEFVALVNRLVLIAQ